MKFVNTGNLLGRVGSNKKQKKIKKVEEDISCFSKVILAFDCMGPPSHFSFTFRRKKKKLCVFGGNLSGGDLEMYLKMQTRFKFSPHPPMWRMFLMDSANNKNGKGHVSISRPELHQININGSLPFQVF